MQNILISLFVSIIISTTAQAAPLGYFDGHDWEAGVVNGWAADNQNHEKVIEVQIYVDDATGSDAKSLLGSIKASQPRKDLAPAYKNINHGFSFNLPDLVKDGKPHKVYAFAVESTGKKKIMLQMSPKDFVISPPKPKSK